MIPSTAPKTYTQGEEQSFRAEVRRADGANRKVGRNIDLGREEITLLSPNGDRWALVVSDAGVLSAEARS